MIFARNLFSLYPYLNLKIVIATTNKICTIESLTYNQLKNASKQSTHHPTKKNIWILFFLSSLNKIDSFKRHSFSGLIDSIGELLHIHNRISTSARDRKKKGLIIIKMIHSLSYHLFTHPWPPPYCLNLSTPFLVSWINEYLVVLTWLLVHPTSPKLLTTFGPLDDNTISEKTDQTKNLFYSDPFKVWE